MLDSFETIFDSTEWPPIPLPPDLQKIYGQLRFPPRNINRFVFSNSVSTLDGVTSINNKGGGSVSGNNPNDKFLMGLLRSLADVVIVGAGTVRSIPRHIWNPEHICPEYGDYFKLFRSAIGLASPAVTVIVTATGNLDHSLAAIRSGGAFIATTEAGAERLSRQSGFSDDEMMIIQKAPRLSAESIITALEKRGHRVMLLEGGPMLLSQFLKEKMVNELFLTLSPQIAGRVSEDGRYGLVRGFEFAPDTSVWVRLVQIKKAANHLFLRYSFNLDPH